MLPGPGEDACTHTGSGSPCMAAQLPHAVCPCAGGCSIMAALASAHGTRAWATWAVAPYSVVEHKARTACARPHAAVPAACACCRAVHPPQQPLRACLHHRRPHGYTRGTCVRLTRAGSVRSAARSTPARRACLHHGAPHSGARCRWGDQAHRARQAGAFIATGPAHGEREGHRARPAGAWPVTGFVEGCEGRCAMPAGVWACMLQSQHNGLVRGRASSATGTGSCRQAGTCTCNLAGGCR